NKSGYLYIDKDISKQDINIYEDDKLTKGLKSEDSTNKRYQIYLKEESEDKANSNKNDKYGINLLSKDNMNSFINSFNESKSITRVDKGMWVDGDREALVRIGESCLCNRNISKEELIKLGVSEDNTNIFLNYINSTMKEYNINTCKRKLHFLAQIRHESGEFAYLKEIADGSAYEGRKDLGNTQPGDGKRFKGRGLIQITGRKNYTAYGSYKGINFTDGSNNIKLEEKQYAVDSAGWYWSKHLNVDLNNMADDDDLIYITYRINGGFNGFNDRKNKLINMVSKIDCLKDRFNNLEDNNYSIKKSKAWNIHDAVYKYAVLNTHESNECYLRYLELTREYSKLPNGEKKDTIIKRRKKISTILGAENE
ncbi:glycoside hydrolase family 19 protein, partial [Campylobacter concisus]